MHSYCISRFNFLITKKSPISRRWIQCGSRILVLMGLKNAFSVKGGEEPQSPRKSLVAQRELTTNSTRIWHRVGTGRLTQATLAGGERFHHG